MGQGSSKPSNGTSSKNQPNPKTAEQKPKQPPSSVIYFSGIKTKYDEGYVEEEQRAPDLVAPVAQPQSTAVTQQSPSHTAPSVTLFQPLDRGAVLLSLKEIIQKEEIEFFTLTPISDRLFQGKTLMEVCLETKDPEFFRSVLTWAHGPGSYPYKGTYNSRAEKWGQKIPATAQEITKAISDLIAKQQYPQEIVSSIVKNSTLTSEEKNQFLRVYHEVSPASLQHPKRGWGEVPPRVLGIPFEVVAKIGTPDQFKCLLNFNIFTPEAVVNYREADSENTLLEMAERQKNQPMVEYLQYLALFLPKNRMRLLGEVGEIIEKQDIKHFTHTKVTGGALKDKTLMEICLEIKDHEFFRSVLRGAHGQGSYLYQNKVKWEYRNKPIPTTDKDIAGVVSELVADQLPQDGSDSVLCKIVKSKTLSPEEKINFLRVFHEISPLSLRDPYHGRYDDPPRNLGIPFEIIARFGTPDQFKCLLSFNVFTHQAVAEYISFDSKKSLVEMAEESKNSPMIEYLKKFATEFDAQVCAQDLEEIKINTSPRTSLRSSGGNP